MNIKTTHLLTEKIKVDYNEPIDELKKVKSVQQSPSAWSKPESNKYSDLSQLHSEITEYSAAVDEQVLYR